MSGKRGKGRKVSRVDDRKGSRGPNLASHQSIFYLPWTGHLLCSLLLSVFSAFIHSFIRFFPTTHFFFSPCLLPSHVLFHSVFPTITYVLWYHSQRLLFPYSLLHILLSPFFSVFLLPFLSLSRNPIMKTKDI